ncbi:MAG TPA: helix-turn-helix transcriptional regulator [Thermoanaerobaculia bacterium]|nr:helix-turn-helix transcriptional regulator [Thermoanaerobaculia bacterium]
MRTKLTPTGERGPHARLHHGEFFGQFHREAEAGGFALAHVAADPRNDVQRHTHEAAHFIFVTRGLYVSTASGAPDVASSPLLVYNPPGTTHRDRFRKHGERFEGRFLSISIAAERMTGIADGLTLADASTCIGGGTATALATRLIAELDQWEPASRLAVEGICLELMAEVARRDPFTEKSRPRWLALACEMFREGECSVAEVAAACGVHPVHLARTFRRFLRCSPGAYLRRCRVERAATLLRRGALPLTEVALQSGFADQSHMSRAFQGALAITPAAFRRMFHPKNEVASGQDEPRRTR